MEYEKQALSEIEKTEMPAKAAELKKQGYRLVQICCTSTDVHSITYTFDKDYSFQNFRIVVKPDDLSVPSITESYLAAFTYENELQDLFGLTVNNLKINFNGNFYKLAQKTPYSLPPVCSDPEIKTESPKKEGA